MSVVVSVEQVEARELPPVEYRWDADTDILQAALRAPTVGEGLSGSVDLEGADGSWLTFEMLGGRLTAIEIAVWPDVATRPTLRAPSPAGLARLRMPSRTPDAELEALEVNTAILAVADEAERTIHFRIGPTRPSRPLQVASDLLVEVDARSRLAGFWLLNVPPSPTAP